MNNQRLIQFCAMAAAAALIGGASVLLRPINGHREAMGLSASKEEVKSMPPLPTQALAGFRGLAIDYFWIRAEMLKQQGRYYEANQLASWICKFQPRFAKVWAFQAWNLAWNISVGTRTSRERWNWVHNGIKLLRDEGLVYNPKALSLYRELGWIFFFKMGDYMDDHHWNYKRRWAWDLHRVLGDPPPDIQAEGAQLNLAAVVGPLPQDQTPAAPKSAEPAPNPEDVVDPSVKRVLDWFRPVAEAPADWASLMADADMAALVARCEKAGIELRSSRSAGGGEVNTSFFDKYQRVLTPTFKQQFDLLAGRLVYTPDERALRDLLDDPDVRPRMDRLLAFLRRQVLAVKYKLDAQWMLSLMERFGPIDWRLPDAHGMYWTSWGIKQMDDLNVKNVSEFFGPNTPLNTDRVMLFALQRMTNYSRLFFVPNLEQVDQSVLNLLPDLRFVPATHKAYLETSKKYDPESGKIAGEDLRDGHQNYLRDVIRFYYLYGQQRQAEYYYEYLRTNYKTREGTVNEDYLVPLRDFVFHEEFQERLSDPRIVTDAITGILNQALRFLIMGDADRANGMIRVARQDLYEPYMARWKDNPVDRMKLLPFEEMFNDAVVSNLNTPDASEDALGIKARLWKTLQLPTQLAVYDEVAPTLREQCAAIGLADKMDNIFPPPPGLEEYRKTHAQPGPKEQAPQEYSIEELKRDAQQGIEQRREEFLRKDNAPQRPR